MYICTLYIICQMMGFPSRGHLVSVSIIVIGMSICIYTDPHTPMNGVFNDAILFQAARIDTSQPPS